MNDAGPEHRYVSLAVEASERFHRASRKLLPEGVLSPVDSDAYGAELHEALLALAGLGMIQLVHLGDEALARQLRADVSRFLTREGYETRVMDAYEAAWRASDDEPISAQRIGALFLGTAGTAEGAFTAAHARVVGGRLWAEASGLWRRVAESVR